MLKLLISPKQIDRVLYKKYLLKESDIIVDANSVKDSIIDENIDINNMKNFNSKAFLKLKKIISSKNQKTKCTCGLRGKQIIDKKEPSTRCTRCLIWSHDNFLKVLPNPIEHWY